MKETKDRNFITNDGLMLLYIAKHPQCTARDMAPIIKATERTVHRVLVDLEREGYITRQRTGKGNIYRVNCERRLKHKLTRESLIGDLPDLLSRKTKRKRGLGSHHRRLEKHEY